MGDALHLERYTDEAKALVVGAQSLADQRHHNTVETVHLLVFALENDSTLSEMVSKIASVETIISQCNEAMKKVAKATSGQAGLSHEMVLLIKRAEESAIDKVSVEQVLFAIISAPRSAASTILATNKVTQAALIAAENAKVATFVRDMTGIAKKGHDPIIGRDGEVRRVLQILGRRSKNNPILVGEAGVGKRTIVQSLAIRLANNDVPNKAHFPLLEVDLAAVQATAKGRSEVDERLKKVLTSILTKHQHAVVFLHAVDSLLAGQGSNTTMDILKHFMQRGLRVIASTSGAGKKALDKDANLVSMFTVVQVEPSSVEETKEILRGIAKRYEEHHKVSIGENAIAAAVRMSKRYLKDRGLPAAAIDLLDEAASRKHMEMGSLPANIDDAQRRLTSLHTQLECVSGKSDADSLKATRLLNAELDKLTPAIDEMKAKATMSYINKATVNELKAKYAEMMGQKTTAEVMDDKELTARLGAELPDLKAKLNIAEQALASVKDDEVSNAVNEEHIAGVLQDLTGINATKMLESETEKLLSMEKRLAKRVFGQDEALRLLARSIRRSRLGLRDPKKPIGSFLFLGSSGTGKTETAKALAEFLFDDEKSFLRLDMSEYRESHQAQKLLGSPPGYVDSGNGGLLTNHIDKYPMSVILSDEIEKGSGAVHDLFLQILDDGRLTSGTGKTSFFNDSVVIMTSNIGTADLLDAADKTPEKFETEEGRNELTKMVREKLKDTLRPEFINRIDHIVLFQPLTRQHLLGVVDIQVRQIEKLLEHKELHLALTQAAKEEIVERSYEPAFGARPTLRSMVKYVQDPMAEELLTGGYQPGDCVAVDYNGAEFVFSNSRVVEVPAERPSRVQVDLPVDTDEEVISSDDEETV